ncbi:MAG: hypothetical protein JRG97_09195 [Deltaproteobacteria bacterium]|nr:hypothetical protein [Deltaproteobacteria bacterium]
MKTKPNSSTAMLVLWDIDGTLLTTSGAGSAAFLLPAALEARPFLKRDVSFSASVSALTALTS